MGGFCQVSFMEGIFSKRIKSGESVMESLGKI